MTSIADIQAKLVDKMAEKLPSRSAINPRSIGKVLSEFDTDNDGFLSLNEFRRSVERCGNALDGRETDFLFAFWDTCAGEREPCGRMEIRLAVQDLMGGLPDYQAAFNSGPDAGAKYSGNKSNAPSQTGGIFGGGSYEADARGLPMPSTRPAPGGMPVNAPYSEQAPNRPRGNQSSISGGIFNPEPVDQAPSSNRGGNRSNKSSIAGGIFGEQPQQALAPAKRFNSNASSIPGGIFG